MSTFLFCIKVSRRDVEVGVAPVVFNPNFAKQVNYLKWIYYHTLVIISAIPQEVTPLLSLVRPLTLRVWLCFAGAIALLIIVKQIFWAVQAVRHVDIRDAGRIVISMSLFTHIMFELLYSDSLVSCLVAKEFEQPIDTITDLYDSGLMMNYLGNTSIGRYLENHPSKEMKHIVQYNSQPFPFNGKVPSYVRERLVISKYNSIAF